MSEDYCAFCRAPLMEWGQGPEVSDEELIEAFREAILPLTELQLVELVKQLEKRREELEKEEPHETKDV